MKKKVDKAASPKTCDHTSVGIVVWRDNKILLIERRRPPYGIAVPAGHVDARKSYEDAARAELFEEVGLEAETLELLCEGRKENPCRRQLGTWHYWKIFSAKATGDIRRSKIETKDAFWCSAQKLQELARRSELFRLGRVDHLAWQQRPGLEPVWYDWFVELDYIEPVVF